MKRGLVFCVLLVLALVFTGTAMAAELSKPVATYQLKDANGVPINFFVYRTHISNGDRMFLPNNQYLDIKDGTYPAWVVDMVQDGKNIFMVTASRNSSQVWHYNGTDFYPFLRGYGRVEATPVERVNHPLTLVYSLLPLDGDDHFEGLLIFQDGAWKFFHYHNRGGTINSAEQLDLYGAELRILHHQWKEGERQDQTYFNLVTPDRGFYEYVPGKEPYKRK